MLLLFTLVVTLQISIGEMLVNNASLVHLDLTNTRLGSEACVMLGTVCFLCCVNRLDVSLDK